MDTNQWTLPMAALQRFDTPDALLWWVQPPDLLRHAPPLDTNFWTLPYPGHLFDPPGALWWSQPPDLLHRPPPMDTNQGLDLWYVPIQLAAVATPPQFWWSQPPDLLHHPPTMATETPRQATWFNATLDQLAQAWWAQPPDLLRHAPPLDTNQQRLVSQQFATPTAFGFWAQPPGLLRHAPHLDTNQGFDYAADPISRGPVITPPLFWWSQPPDLIRHPVFLETNQPRLVQQPGANMWWAQPPALQLLPPGLWHGQQFNDQWALSSLGYLGLAPQPIAPRAPLLWGAQPYVAPGWAFRGAGPFIAPHPLNRPVALTQPPGLALLEQRIVSPGPTPGLFWWRQPPDLLWHPPTLWTWQEYIGKLPPRFVFRGTCYNPERAPLLIPAAKPRIFIPWRTLLSTAASAPRKNIASRVVSNRVATAQGCSRMSRAPDLCPPIVAQVEQEYVRFDFAPGLQPGVTILAIVAVNCYSLDGSDQTPMARILSTPEIVDSPSSLLPEQAVIALFGDMIAGLYLVQAIIQTSDGQTLSVEARWPCVNATP
jgi:hypothetical protein